MPYRTAEELGEALLKTTYKLLMAHYPVAQYMQKGLVYKPPTVASNDNERL